MTIKHYTGQMTKAELQNTKIRILSEAHSKAFQEMCFEVDIKWNDCKWLQARFTAAQYLIIGESMKYSRGFDAFNEKVNQEITWTPVDMSNAPENATHFTKELWLKESRTAPSGWSAKFVYGTDSFYDQNTLDSDIYKISDFIGENMTVSIIDQIRDILPEDAEIAIGHKHINLFVDDYCFTIETIEDINKIQTALKTIKEYQA